MPTAFLSRVAAERTITVVRDQLGRTDRTRLAALPPLIREDRRIQLSEALTTLFPGQDRAAALASFQQFRSRIEDAATEARVRFTLEADTHIRTAADRRWCWFAGDDGAAEAAARFTESETRNVIRTPQTAVQVGKRKVRYFVSYAHADAPLKDRLLHL